MLFRKILRWVGIVFGILLLAFILMLLVPGKEVVAPIQPRANTAYWNMQEGFKIAYTYLENPDSVKKDPIIFLHGGPGGYVHSSIIEALSNLTTLGHEVYLYDQRGSGLSDRLPKFSDVSFEKHIADLHEIITTKIKADRVILMGQSFGCRIIAHYSSSYPDQLSSIILTSPGSLAPPRQINGTYVDLDTLYPIPDSISFITPTNGFKVAQRAAMGPKAIVATLGALLLDKKLVADKQMDRILNTMATHFTKGMVCDIENVQPEEGGGGLYAYLATNNDDIPEIRDKIKNLDLPVLVMQGQCDYIPYATAYEYADLYPNARYTFIENAGHEIWWDQEVIFLNRISGFLLEIDTPETQE